MPQTTIGRYCALENKICEKTYLTEQTPSLFLAHAGLRHEFLSDAIAAATVPIFDPLKRFQDFDLYCNICHAIRSSKVVVADVSEFNLNVAFELGYAVGTRKPAYLIAANEAKENIPSVFNFLPGGYIGFYTKIGECASLLNEIYKNPPNVLYSELEATLLEDSSQPTLLFFNKVMSSRVDLIKVRTENGLHSHKLNGAVEVANVEETVATPLYDCFAKLHRAKSIIIPFMQAENRLYRQYNATLAFFAGIAFALHKPLLMLSSPDSLEYFSDAKGLAKVWSTESQLIRHLNNWIDAIAPYVKSQLTDETLAPGEKDAFYTFNVGSPSAETDAGREISFYLSDAIRAVTSGVPTIVRGNRGSGKTATIKYILESHDSANNLAIPFVPPFELMEGLVEVVGQVDLSNNPRYVLSNYWQEIFALVAIQLVSTIDTHSTSALELKARCEDYVSHSPYRLSDITSLCTEVMKKYIGIPTQPSLYLNLTDRQDRVAIGLFEQIVSEFKCWILIDEIDRVWDEKTVGTASELFIGMLRFIHGLRGKGRTKMSLFIRDDAYRLLVKSYEDLQQFDRVELTWSNEELVEMLGLRIKDHFLVTAGEDYDSAWKRLFVYTDSFDPREYVIDRSVGRPRFMIMLVTAALSQARRNRADRIAEHHLRAAMREFAYSIAYELGKEFEHQVPNCPKLLKELRQFPSTNVETIRKKIREVCEVSDDKKLLDIIEFLSDQHVLDMSSTSVKVTRAISG